jgi:hypothetical protein
LPKVQMYMYICILMAVEGVLARVRRFVLSNSGSNLHSQLQNIFKKIFLSIYFFQVHTMTMHIKDCNVKIPKTLHPGRIQNRDLLSCRRTRLPLCHAARALQNIIPRYKTSCPDIKHHTQIHIKHHKHPGTKHHTQVENIMP